MEGDKSSVIEETTNRIERKYDLDHSEAKARVEDAVDGKVKQKRLYRAESRWAKLNEMSDR